tara:strand:- start:140 stop:247 length:108 start_codon:yes stop_codon:yes gene_type:complete
MRTTINRRMLEDFKEDIVGRWDGVEGGGGDGDEGA